jgi:hypothetical protein
MVTVLRRGIHFILLLGMMMPLSACQPSGHSDDDEKEKTGQEEKENEEHEDKEDKNKSKKDD